MIYKDETGKYSIDFAYGDYSEYEREVIRLAVNVFGFLIRRVEQLSFSVFAELIKEAFTVGTDKTAETIRILER